jgi:hypothetical protein
VRPDELPVSERATAAVQQEDVWSMSIAAVVDDGDGAVRRADAMFDHLTSRLQLDGIPIPSRQ